MPLTSAIQLTPTADAAPDASLSVVIVAEGFLTGEQDAFIDACYALLDRLTARYPLSLLKASPYPVTFYYAFEPSAQHGPDTSSTPPSGRTTFDAHLDPSSGALQLSNARVTTVLQDIGLPKHDGSLVAAADLAPKGDDVAGQQGVEVLALLPEITQPAAGADAYYGREDATSGTHHYTATTLNGEWHQVLARRFGSRFGLADEFERTGSEYLAPSGDQAAYLNVAAPNLIATSDASQLPGLASKWSAYLPGPLRSQFTVHSHSGGPNAANDTPLFDFPYAPPPGFWEGGGGFRTEVYRPAADCLMRRRIGSQTLSCRAGRVEFCPICARHLQRHLIPR